MEFYFHSPTCLDMSHRRNFTIALFHKTCLWFVVLTSNRLKQFVQTARFNTTVEEVASESCSARERSLLPDLRGSSIRTLRNGFKPISGWQSKCRLFVLGQVGRC